MRGPNGERGIVLVVDTVLERGWFRSRLKVLPQFLSEDTSPGIFQAKRLVPDGGIGARVVMTELLIEQEKPLHLVCRGRRWQEGEAVTQADILSHYEP